MKNKRDIIDIIKFIKKNNKIEDFDIRYEDVLSFFKFGENYMKTSSIDDTHCLIYLPKNEDDKTSIYIPEIQIYVYSLSYVIDLFYYKDLYSYKLLSALLEDGDTHFNNIMINNVTIDNLTYFMRQDAINIYSNVLNELDELPKYSNLYYKYNLYYIYILKNILFSNINYKHVFVSSIPMQKILNDLSQDNPITFENYTYFNVYNIKSSKDLDKYLYVERIKIHDSLFHNYNYRTQSILYEPNHPINDIINNLKEYMREKIIISQLVYSKDV